MLHKSDNPAASQTSLDVKWSDCICGLQSYAQQLQETERRLADLMRTEQRLRHHRRSGTADQQQPLDPNLQQGPSLAAVISPP